MTESLNLRNISDRGFLFMFSQKGEGSQLLNDVNTELVGNKQSAIFECSSTQIELDKKVEFSNTVPTPIAQTTPDKNESTEYHRTANVKNIEMENQVTENYPIASTSALSYNMTTDSSETFDSKKDSEPVSTNSSPKKINLPDRETLSVKFSKPSASIEPYNFVKFETATGETFYFSKYLKQPHNLLPKTMNNTKSKRIRTAFTDAHLRILEEEYCKSRYANGNQRKRIAQSLNLTEKCVKHWYQNRRMRDRRQVIDIESDDEDSLDNKSNPERFILQGRSFTSTSDTIAEPVQTLIPDVYKHNECRSKCGGSHETGNFKLLDETAKTDSGSDVILIKSDETGFDSGNSNSDIDSNPCKKSKLISQLVFESDAS